MGITRAVCYRSGGPNLDLKDKLDRFAYTACCHRDATHPSLTLERLLLWQGSSIGADGRFSSAILSCQANGLWPPARKCERVHSYD